MIQAVVFDLDDTLFPERQFVQSGFRAVGEYVKERFGVDAFFEHAERIFAQGTRGTVFNLALEKLGLEINAPVIAELLRVYRDHRPQIDLYDDARWAIDFFYKSKKLGIITDGFFITQRNKVRALGIESNFDVLLYSDEYGRENWKPSPVPYQKVMAALACSGKQCVYIADNPRKDFVTARKLGWHTIRICRKTSEYSHLMAEEGYDADNRIESLFELKEMVE